MCRDRSARPVSLQRAGLAPARRTRSCVKAGRLRRKWVDIPAWPCHPLWQRSEAGQPRPSCTCRLGETRPFRQHPCGCGISGPAGLLNCPCTLQCDEQALPTCICDRVLDMRFRWLYLLLLATFAYWATGAAKFVHETTEHQGGRVGLVSDDDDDDCKVGSATPDGGRPDRRPEPAQHGHPCPVCQVLAAMVVHGGSTSLPPAVAADPIAVLTVQNHASPVVRPSFSRLTTGPPVSPSRPASLPRQPHVPGSSASA